MISRKAYLHIQAECPEGYHIRQLRALVVDAYDAAAARVDVARARFALKSVSTNMVGEPSYLKTAAAEFAAVSDVLDLHDSRWTRRGRPVPAIPEAELDGKAAA